MDTIFIENKLQIFNQNEIDLKFNAGDFCAKFQQEYLEICKLRKIHQE